MSSDKEASEHLESLSEDELYVGDPTLTGRIVDFFLTHEDLASKQADRPRFAQEFNEEIGSHIPDSIRVRDAEIPVYPFSDHDPEVSEKAQRIKSSSKSWYNRGVRKIKTNRNMSFGDLREGRARQNMINVSQNTLSLIRAMFARSE